MTETVEHRRSSLPVSLEDDTLEATPTDPDQETTDEIEDLDQAAKKTIVESARQDIRER